MVGFKQQERQEMDKLINQMLNSFDLEAILDFNGIDEGTVIEALVDGNFLSEEDLLDQLMDEGEIVDEEDVE